MIGSYWFTPVRTQSTNSQISSQITSHYQKEVILIRRLAIIEKSIPVNKN